MFIGHFAVGLAVKRAAPRASLGALLAAPMLLDLLWPFFLVAGWEHVRIDPGNTAFTPLAFDSYPWSHSLLMSAIWATLFGGVYQALTRYLPGTICIWLGVVSHWVLEVITHRPDMPLYPGGKDFLGLGLWNSKAGTVLVEGLMFLAAVLVYVKQTRAHDRIGSIGFWSFIGVVAALYVSVIFGPPPPDVRALTFTAFFAWLFVLWAWWFDRHRDHNLLDMSSSPG